MRFFFILITCFSILSLTVSAQHDDPVSRFLSPDTSHSQAIDQLDDFPSPLSASDLAACLAFLSQRFDYQTDNLLVVRQNDLADLLLQESDSVESATHVLLRVIADDSADLVWREYCLQKLPMAYQQQATPESLRAEILATLRLRATDPHISFSGTSLLGLYRLRDTAGLEPSELIERATYILNEPSLATSNQVTALQLAALLGDPDALGLARSLAVDTSISIQLRISAVASIGQRGTLADLRLIQPLVASPDLRLRNAARFAIKRLESAPTVETL